MIYKRNLLTILRYSAALLAFTGLLVLEEQFNVASTSSYYRPSIVFLEVPVDRPQYTVDRPPPLGRRSVRSSTSLPRLDYPKMSLHDWELPGSYGDDNDASDAVAVYGLIRSGHNPDTDSLKPLERYLHDVIVSRRLPSSFVNSHPFKYVVKPQACNVEVKDKVKDEGKDEVKDKARDDVKDEKKKFEIGNYIREAVNNEVEERKVASDDVFLVVYVHSSAENVEARDRIRRTWGAAGWYDVRVRVVFVIGKPANDADLQRRIVVEAHERKDIIQENFVDAERNTTHKAVAAMKWISKHCRRTKYVLKTDDNVFVNVFSLLEILSSPPLADNGDDVDRGRKLLACKLYWKVAHSPVRREGDWAIKQSEWRYSSWPPFCHGAAFVMSANLAVELFDVTVHVPFLWLDHIYLTGFAVLGVANVTRLSIGTRYTYANTYKEALQSTSATDLAWRSNLFVELNEDLQQMDTFWKELLRRRVRDNLSFRRYPADDHDDDDDDDDDNDDDVDDNDTSVLPPEFEPPRTRIRVVILNRIDFGTIALYIGVAALFYKVVSYVLQSRNRRQHQGHPHYFNDDNISSGLAWTTIESQDDEHISNDNEVLKRSRF